MLHVVALHATNEMSGHGTRFNASMAVANGTAM
jgi:hypothetical protein